jgi:CheY-like chemotaxis protein
VRILLVDDNVRYRRAGKQELEKLGHDVVALSDYGEARVLAEKENFDAALLDLLMPTEPTTLGPKGLRHLGKEIGVGFPLLLALAHSNVNKIAVATDTNHHDHPMSAVVDWFGAKSPLTVNGKKVLVMHASLHEDGTKDWASVLRALVETSS